MDPGPIPWRDIVAYGAWMQLDEGNVRALVTIIRAMDTAWLEWQSEQAKKRSKQPA